MTAGLKAIVLVGGFGTRLRPITYHTPKHLIPIAGKPVLYHCFDALPKAVTEINLACGYMVEEHSRYIREHPYRIPVKVITEEKPLLTGGAMLNASKGVSGEFVLMNGDVICGLDGDEMLEYHRRKKAYGTMFLVEQQDVTTYGVAGMDAEDRIEEFVEKPAPEDAPSHWINAGMSVWNADVINAVPAGTPISFEREIMPKLLTKPVYGFKSKTWWEDVGTPERVLHAQRLIFDNLPQKQRETHVHLPGAKAAMPVCVGGGCSAEGSRIGPYVTLGNGVKIGKGSIIEDSIIMDGAEIGEDSIVVRSIVGDKTIIPNRSRIEGKCIAREPERY